MKRSEMVQTLINAVFKASSADLELTVEEASEVLTVLKDAGLSFVIDGEESIYEPEEGWDAWIAEEDRKDNLRDFQIVKGARPQGLDIAERFLNGQSFEEIAQHYNVTRERIRQIVSKERRRYFRSLKETEE